MTPDSSVVVAAFANWNKHHEAALDALGDVRDLIAHVELETHHHGYLLLSCDRGAAGTYERLGIDVTYL